MNNPVLSSRVSSIFRSFLGGFFLATPLALMGQVAVNTDGSTAAPSAILDVKSNIMGMLIPRMTTAERNGITAPATSLLVFDTNTNTFWFYNGTQWEQLVSTSVLPGPVVITPPLLTATANNYNPTGFGTATEVRVSGNNGIQMITGFNAETNGEEKTLAVTYYTSLPNTAAAQPPTGSPISKR